MNYEVNPFQDYESITIDELKDQTNSLLNLVTEEQRPLRVFMNNGKEFLLFPQDLLAPICDSDFRLILLSAMRYAMGRNTCIPMVVADYIKRHIQLLDDKFLVLAADDIRRHLEDYAEHELNPNLWQSLLGALETEQEERATRKARKIRPCPACGKPLEVMSIADNQHSPGGFDVIAHCRNCLTDYEWFCDKDGGVSDMKQYFLGYNLFCVGDDWQSIYRFNGSDIGFILNFEKYWGASAISRIETTYRFPQSLISVSSGFIMKNPEQNQKQLRSAVADRGFSMEKITGYTESYAVEFLAERLRELPEKSSVLFLGRYRFDIKMLDGHSRFSYQYNAALGRTKVSFARRTDLQISFMTAHGSKGLQADYVFLLNTKAYGMGFPSQIADAPILQLLLDNCDHYPFAEERRLFYVAMTRAKKKVWLVTLKGNESVFVKEIDEVYGEAMRREQYACPLCGGRLVRRSGPYGEFFGCSNYKTSGCRYIRNIGKSKGQRTDK